MKSILITGGAGFIGSNLAIPYIDNGLQGVFSSMAPS
jgi:nucleoside-diphosphate-sugar epimerase